MNSKKLSVFIVDDYISILRGVKSILEKDSLVYNGTKYTFIVETFENREQIEAYLKLKKSKPDIILLDIIFEDGDISKAEGSHLFVLCREQFKPSVIIMYSQMDDEDTIAHFFLNGADGFISKKTKFNELSVSILQRYEISLNQNKSQVFPVKGNQIITGKTLFALTEKIINRTNGKKAIHIFGERGSGKNMVIDVFQNVISGNKIHLIESAHLIKPKIPECDWVILKDVDQLTLNNQSELNKILNKRGIKILSTADTNLQNMVGVEKFDSSLWKKLCKSVFYIPPMRERTKEIPEIATSIAMRDGYTISPAVIEIFQQYDWKGNYLEMCYCISKMIEQCSNNILSEKCISKEYLIKFKNYDHMTIKLDLDHLHYKKIEEKLFINCVKALVETFNIKPMCQLSKMLNLSNNTVRRRINKLIKENKI